MSGDKRARVRAAMDTALCFQLGPAQRNTSSARPSAPPESTDASAAARMELDPLAGPDFITLRELRQAFARGGMPPQSERTPADEARIASFCVLQELAQLLGQYRRTVIGGGRARLVVSEHGRQLGKMAIEVKIEPEPT